MFPSTPLCTITYIGVGDGPAGPAVAGPIIYPYYAERILLFGGSDIPVLRALKGEALSEVPSGGSDTRGSDTRRSTI